MSWETDVLILGCGIAGTVAAMRLARDPSIDVTVVSHRANPADTATSRAQGGIISRGLGDTAERLVADILRAGDGLSRASAATRLAVDGPRLVEEILISDLEVPFCRDENGCLQFAHEGAHSLPRVLYNCDETGRVIEERLIRKLRNLPNVRLLAGRTAVDLITTSDPTDVATEITGSTICCGAYLLDQATGEVERVLAGATVLATGGLGRIFRCTTNPAGARGDGFAMAYRAGARMENLEYVQFHPTTLAVPGARNFLISEAVRGAGARLLTPDGDRFMARYAPEWGDLASRDIVARAMHSEMAEHGYPYLLLDLRDALAAEKIAARFPTIVAACRRAGVDMAQDPIPVVPAAHYACGGVLVDVRGRSSIPGLYAAGEVSCTGVHGANRLGSASLLEGLVWGHAAGEDIATRRDLDRPRACDVAEWTMTGDGSADPALVSRDLETVQSIMWQDVGLSRRGDRLARAASELDCLMHGVDALCRTHRLDDALIGLRNAVQCAWLVCGAAMGNRRSRGTHWREDTD